MESIEIEFVTEAYAGMSKQLEEQVADANPRISYHLFADALYWNDEIPASFSSENENFLRLVLRYRTSLIESREDLRCREYWRHAKSAFPNWIGFTRQRCDQSDRLTKRLNRYRKHYDRRLDSLIED